MVESLVASSYVAVIVIGLIHGLEPGHGWPVAALLSARAKRQYAYGTAAGGILASAHFLSSLAVVAVYYVSLWLFGTLVDFTSSWLKILAAAILLILAFRFFREKADVYGPDSEHSDTPLGPSRVMGLRGLAGFAFILGFAHEEEFMLFALFVGGVNPLVAMSAYATAVSFSLITTTLIAIKALSVLQVRLRKFERYIPKVTGLALTILAVLFLSPVFGGPNVY